MTTVFEDPFSEEVWVSTYKDHNDNNINDTLRRVARAVASVEATPILQDKWEEIFYDMLSDFKVTAGGRIYANAGTEWRGTTLANCFVGRRATYDIDSLKSILWHLEGQAQTLKSEGGWGENFSYIRPRGAFIHGVGVESPGAVKYMELFDKSSDVITQGSGTEKKEKKAKGKIRKGAQMTVLDIWHPDIIEFITAKQTPFRLTKFNMSVNVTDEFMNALKADSDWDLIFPDTTFEHYKAEWFGDMKEWKSKGYPVIVYQTVKASWLWDLIMKSTYTRAEPGVLFLDRANYYNPGSYFETIYATNPSMPAGTLVHTKEGIFPIDKLEGKTFLTRSLDGKWNQSECFKSGNNKPLVKISFDGNGYKYLRSTKEHKYPVLDQRMDRLYRIEAGKLKVGDLIPLNLNESFGIEGDMTLTRDEGFFIGYFIVDGWFSTRTDGSGYTIGLIFNKTEEDMALKILHIINNMKKEKSTITKTKNGYLTIQTTDQQFCNYLMGRFKLIPGTKDIPDILWTSNDEFIKGFIDGLFSSDGHVRKSNLSVSFKSSRFELVENVSKLLSFVGLKTCIWKQDDKDVKFPNGKIYDRTYTSWSCAMTGPQVAKFANIFNISHSEKKKKLEENIKNISTRYAIDSEYMRIYKIEEVAPEDVWDISVYHEQHVFPVEWCYTGNCGEQMLSPGNICLLISQNLTQFVDRVTRRLDYKKVKTYVKYMVRFIDNVCSLTNTPLPEYDESIRNKRRVGCGVLGWGSALYMMKVPFASKEALQIQEELMRTFATAAYEASIDLAIEKGMFPLCEPEKHAATPFVQSLDLSPSYMKKLKTTGIRNSSLLSIQPTGGTGILANIVTGGCEPAWMYEYIRTSICPEIPEHIKDVCPQWFMGEFEDTELFKWTKEGEEEILRGEKDGIVYKIDRNRGLTKETLCEDYGVRFLKKHGEWDPNAEWVKTTSNLTVEEHLNDLRGFARWIDSAISKTINVPNDYSFEDFKNIYIDAYDTGYIKGLTTYRAGTMTSVLSAKEEKTATNCDEEIIQDDVKLPDSLPATMKILKSEGRKWYLTVIKDESGERPVAMFVHTNSPEKNITTNNAVDKLIELAYNKKIPTRHIESTEDKIRGESNTSKLTRCISLLLRHGVLIKNVVAVLDKVDGVFVGSFLFQIKRYLASYIKDGEKVENEKCIDCGSEAIVFREGCKSCSSCGSSKCG